AIRVEPLGDPPTMTFAFRQAGKRARPIYQTGSLGALPKGPNGSRAVFQSIVHHFSGLVEKPGVTKTCLSPNPRLALQLKHRTRPNRGAKILAQLGFFRRLFAFTY